MAWIAGNSLTYLMHNVGNKVGNPDKPLYRDSLECRSRDTERGDDRASVV